MVNKNDNGSGCLIFLVIIILVALSNMKEENKNHIDELEYEIDELEYEIRQLRNKLEYRNN